MNNNFPKLGRCLSILDRLMKMYYDRNLADFEIGWGQQFYVEYLYDHPGASAQEMVECIRVDKGTLTKVIKKLTEIGYVEVVAPRRHASRRRHFSWISHPIDFRSGSSPAVVRTMTACCVRAASEPAVRTSHRRRLG